MSDIHDYLLTKADKCKRRKSIFGRRVSYIFVASLEGYWQMTQLLTLFITSILFSKSRLILWQFIPKKILLKIIVHRKLITLMSYITRLLL